MAAVKSILSVATFDLPYVTLGDMVTLGNTYPENFRLGGEDWMGSTGDDSNGGLSDDMALP
jgi:hypothetical protein